MHRNTQIKWVLEPYGEFDFVQAAPQHLLGTWDGSNHGYQHCVFSAFGNPAALGMELCFYSSSACDMLGYRFRNTHPKIQKRRRNVETHPRKTLVASSWEAGMFQFICEQKLDVGEAQGFLSMAEAL